MSCSLSGQSMSKVTHLLHYILQGLSATGVGRLNYLLLLVWDLQTYSESRGHNFILNATFDSIDADSYDALVVPGGRAPEYLSLNETVLKLVQKFASANKPLASICHGPLILAAAGVLKGKQSTAYPTLKPTVLAAGGKWLDPEPISASFTDGNLITAAAWPGHPEFLKQILTALGAKIEGQDKKVLFICGVRCDASQSFSAISSLALAE